MPAGDQTEKLSLRTQCMQSIRLYVNSLRYVYMYTSLFMCLGDVSEWDSERDDNELSHETMGTWSVRLEFTSSEKSPSSTGASSFFLNWGVIYTQLLCESDSTYKFKTFVVKQYRFVREH